MPAKEEAGESQQIPHLLSFYLRLEQPLDEPRQEAACVHPFREREVVEECLSPHDFPQPYLDFIMLHKAILWSYSLPSGVLGQQYSC